MNVRYFFMFQTVFVFMYTLRIQISCTFFEIALEISVIYPVPLGARISRTLPAIPYSVVAIARGHCVLIFAIFYR